MISEDADELLVSSYRLTSANLRRYLSIDEMADHLGWDVNKVVGAGRYLSGKGFLKWQAVRLYSLTPYGIDAVERLHTDPDKMKQRLEFLMQSYGDSEGNPRNVLNMWQVGERLGWSRELTAEVYEYLSSKRLVAGFSHGGGFGITDATVDLVERARSRPDSPTEYFPPLSSLNLRDSTIVASNIGSPGGTVQTGDINIQTGGTDELSKALDMLEQAITASQVDASAKQDALSDVASLKAQGKRSAANPAITKALWSSLAERVPSVIEGLVKSGAIAALVKWATGA